MRDERSADGSDVFRAAGPTGGRRGSAFAGEDRPRRPFLPRAPIAGAALSALVAAAATVGGARVLASEGRAESELVPRGASAGTPVRPREGAGGAEWVVECDRAAFRWRWRTAGAELEVLDLGVALPVWRPPAHGSAPRLAADGDDWTLSGGAAPTHRLSARGRSVRIEGAPGVLLHAASPAGTVRTVRADLADGLEIRAVVGAEQRARYAGALASRANGVDALWLTWSDQLADLLPEPPRAGAAPSDRDERFFVFAADDEELALLSEFGVRGAVAASSMRFAPWSFDAWRAGAADLWMVPAENGAAVPVPHFVFHSLAAREPIVLPPVAGSPAAAIDRAHARSLALGADAGATWSDAAGVAREWWAMSEASQRVAKARGPTSEVRYRLRSGEWTSLSGALAAGELEEVVTAVHVRHAGNTDVYVNLTGASLDVTAAHGRRRRLAPYGRLVQAPDFEAGLLESRGAVYEVARGPTRFFVDSRGASLDVELLKIHGAVAFDLGVSPAVLHFLPEGPHGRTTRIELSPSWVTRLAADPWATWYEMEATWRGPGVEPIVERLRCNERHALELDPARWNEQGFTRLELVSLAPPELRPMGH